MNAKQLTEALREMAESLERLACGDDGLMDTTDTHRDVAALLVEMQDVVQLVEDEAGGRFTRLTDDELEDMARGWFHAASMVGVRHGEEG